MELWKKIDAINTILSEWDPIEVGKELASDEYKGYIPDILKNIDSKDNLFTCLINILVNEIGLEYDSTNQEQNTDLIIVCDKLYNLNQLFPPEFKSD
jgi:hypothetical protein